MQRFGFRRRLQAPIHDTKVAVNIVLNILGRHAPQGLSSKQIFEEAIALHPPGPPLPPQNSSPSMRSAFGMNIQPMPEPLNHPLRSLKFLKSVVLKELQQRRQIDKSCVTVHEDTLSEAERERFVVQGRGVGEPKAWRWTLGDPGKGKQTERR